MISPQQYRKLMSSYHREPNLSHAALRAGVERKTARKYVRGAAGPLEGPIARHWRTRADAFEEVWAEVEAQLWREPHLQAKTLFWELQRQHPSEFSRAQRRSFERRVRRWKLAHGAEPTLLFVQEHRPGERLQLDWWDATELQVCIAGAPYPHKLVAVVLPFSNWQWARPCRSESFLSLKSGLQGALWQLRAVPQICQTDQSSTATHPKGKGKHGREFNERYLSPLAHYGMKAATIACKAPEQNGDVESAHRHLKEALLDGLRLRGIRDFADLPAYEGWLSTVLEERNGQRQLRLGEELAQMRALPPIRLPEYEELTARVSREALVRVGHQAYSVPARYVGQQVRVRVEELWLSFYCGAECMERVERQPGSSQGVYINWRHVVPQMLRRPGAMLRWRHRASLFPSALWRRSFDVLVEQRGERRAEREYLKLLELAIDHGLPAVAAELMTLGAAVSLEAVRERLGLAACQQRAKIITIEFRADLHSYDALLSGSLEEMELETEEDARAV